jgi:methylated-DNA-[protein]-cysteine S-methyltransferase
MTTTAYALFESPVGACGVAWRDAVIVGAQLPEANEAATRARMQKRFPEAPEATPPDWVQAAIDRTVALMRGAKDDLSDIPLALDSVPPFHRRVYELALAIPVGEVLTYGEMAKRLGEPGAARAVGQALGQNPFAPIVPCHRILAADGRSGGFSGGSGVETKLTLLNMERARTNTAPDLFGDLPLAVKPR